MAFYALLVGAPGDARAVITFVRWIRNRMKGTATISSMNWIELLLASLTKLRPGFAGGASKESFGFMAMALRRL